jgi:hypothetical protein
MGEKCCKPERDDERDNIRSSSLGGKRRRRSGKKAGPHSQERPIVPVMPNQMQFNDGQSSTVTQSVHSRNKAASARDQMAFEGSEPFEGESYQSSQATVGRMMRFTAGDLSKQGSVVTTRNRDTVYSEATVAENLMNPDEAISAKDFEKIKVIGRGAFAKVYLVRKRDTQNYYAMKILKKHQLMEKNLWTKTLAERSILEQV